MRVLPSTAPDRSRIGASSYRTDWVRRVAIVLLIFAVAFVLDTVTGNRWTSLWGSTAILVSGLITFPAIRTPLVLGTGYVLLWTIFNVARAFADNTPWAGANLGLALDIESSLTAGVLPTRWLQDTFLDADRLHWYDGLMTLVYLSYFIVPHIVAVILLVRNRLRFQRYLIASAVLFLLSVLSFVGMSADPPWRSTEAIRVVPEVLASTPAGTWFSQNSGSGASYAFEPNAVASWPSVHLGITVVLALLATGTNPHWRTAATVYALLMGIALVYLGEHYMVDVAGGAGFAVVTWQTSRAWVRAPRPAAAATALASGPRPDRDRAKRQRSGSIDGAPRTV